MRFDDRKPPLWLERDAETYGRNLTPVEYQDELDDRPPRSRLLLIRGGRSSSSCCHSNSPPVPGNAPKPGDGPDYPTAA